MMTVVSGELLEMTPHKLRRNEPCWCGSGQKYKRCHLNRENQPSLEPWEASKRFRKAFSAKKCLAPRVWLSDCQGKISRTHTVPKSGSLKTIARNGHVYSFVPGLEKTCESKDIIAPELHGIGHASTFSGFCAKHDNDIFSPLEKKNFRATQEQCFLLGYRAISREYYTKHASVNLSDMRRESDKGRNVIEQVEIQTFNKILERGLVAGLRDIHYHKQAYDGNMMKQQFDLAQAYIIEIEGPPPVMCSGALFPEQDFNGAQLQDLLDLSRVPDMLCLSSFYGGQYGVIALTWLAQSDGACRPFIDSLKTLPDRCVSGALLRLIFTHSENVHISPVWWEGLPVRIRTILLERLALSSDPFSGRQEAYLQDDGVPHAPWKVVKRYEIPGER